MKLTSSLVVLALTAAALQLPAKSDLGPANINTPSTGIQHPDHKKPGEGKRHKAWCGKQKSDCLVYFQGNRMYVSGNDESSNEDALPSIKNSQITHVDFRKECYIKIFGIPDCIKDRNYHKEYRLTYLSEGNELSHAMITFKHQGAYHDFDNEFQNWRILR